VVFPAEFLASIAMARAYTKAKPQGHNAVLLGSLLRDTNRQDQAWARGTLKFVFGASKSAFLLLNMRKHLLILLQPLLQPLLLILTREANLGLSSSRGKHSLFFHSGRL
jgi:hypothetical protein